jgi:tetratricopeptide (TPR) repeat protein
VTDAQTLAHAELKLSGLVRSDGEGRLRVANEIYRRLFDQVWIAGQASGFERIGIARESAFDLPGALQAYRERLAIAQRLTAADPKNAGWQHDLAVSHDRIGDVLAKQGNLSAALASYQASLAITEHLAAADPKNAGWQHDLAVSRNKIGEVSFRLGDASAALANYQASLAITERIRGVSPGDATWQQNSEDLRGRIADALRARGELASELRIRPVFVSYSRNDEEAAINLRGQLARCGLSVFKDDERIRTGELWLDRLHEAVGRCGAFIVLVGRDGVGRWIGAETQAALNRHFGPHVAAERLPIFPILLGETGPETLPAFLQRFQMTPWNGADALPKRLLDDIRDRTIVATTAAVFKGCPFVGLAAYKFDEAHLFFGRQKETLDALACFDTRRSAATVRWLEINGNSGSGKSSLMQAGLLPLVDAGWMWSRTGFAHWHRIGPMMPGERPVEMLAESLARAWKAEMADVCGRLQSDGDEALLYWLRDQKHDDTAFLLAIDQFEELFTFADPEERRRFDRLLAAALEDPECPLFVISTMRTDFLDRFEDLPQLVRVQNRCGKAWKLAPIGADGLREIIEGPARLAGLDVGEVEEVIFHQALDEPGALPLVENALSFLWYRRIGNRLSGRLFTEHGGLAGILSGSADDLLKSLGSPQQDRALELLFRLVQIDPEARRHTRRRIPLAEAIEVAGGSECGQALVDRLAGQRRRDGGTAQQLRLITVTGEAGKDKLAKIEGWVNLIHEMLIHSKLDPDGKAQPYWPTLWSYIEKNKELKAVRARLQLRVGEWAAAKGAPAKAKRLATGADLEAFVNLVDQQPDWLSDDAWLSADERKLVSDSLKAAIRQQRQERAFAACIIGSLTAIVHGFLWQLAEGYWGWDFRGESLPAGYQAIILSMTLTLPLLILPQLYQAITGQRILPERHYVAAPVILLTAAAGYLIMYGINTPEIPGLKELIYPVGTTVSLSRALFTEVVYAIVYFSAIVLVYQLIAD